MRIDWTSNFSDIGNNFGYSTHQKMLRGALEAEGIIIDPSAPIAVHITTPWFFEPPVDKHNLLYTMYEGENIPDFWIKCLRKAKIDLLVVPCTHNVHVFQPHVDFPIEVCQEGVDTEIYRPYDRSFPKNKPFTFLWVGATNPRKGLAHLKVVWDYWNEMHPQIAKNTELIIKTTREGEREELYQIKENLYLDTRILPLKSNGRQPTMNALYQHADCFLFPSLGEGFGLTLAEAMATALPCIYTPYSGPVDYVNEKMGYPIEYTMGTYTIEEKFRKYDKEDNPREEIQRVHQTLMANPDTASIIQRMKEVYENYDLAIRKGKRAATYIRECLTWKHSARRFIEILEKYFPQEKLEAI